MREKWLVSSVAGILVYLAWAWGGLQPDWLLWAVLATGVLLISILVFPVKTDIEVTSRCTVWWRDVFFYGGILFLGYLAIQWWNAGRVLFFDVGLNEWRYSTPPHPGWPSAFSRSEAAQILCWFFPAWVLGLAVRSPVVGSRALLGLLRTLVYGAGLLALVGIIQFTTHAKARFWIRPTAEFFASFGYTNHAAAFFLLMGALAAGLLFREIFCSEKKHPLRLLVLVASLVFCLVGANFSLSRAGIILAWMLAGFIALYGLIRGWGILHGAGRVNLAVVTLGVVCMFYFAVTGLGKKEITQEFRVRQMVHHRLCPALDKVNLSLAGRPLLDRAAWQMWRDKPILGLGGWGFRYMLAYYLPSGEWNTQIRNPGNANVHCDLLQFLVEFGVIGFGLMVVAVGGLLTALFRNSNWRDPLWILGGIGLVLVLIFSLIDLPFRCPAILCAWVVILAALPKITVVRIQEVGSRKINNR